MTPFDVMSRASDAFIGGLWVTLVLWASACLFGTALGIALGWGLYVTRSSSRLVRLAISWLPEFVKSVPALVLLVWFHYLVPGYFGLSPKPLLTSILVFALIVAIGVAELVRSAIAGIPGGELEAAAAIGLTHFEIGRSIALPLAFRSASPGVFLLYIDILKLSTLASAIALDELLHVTDTVIAGTYVALPAYTALAMIFVGLVVPLNFLARRYSAFMGIQR